MTTLPHYILNLIGLRPVDQRIHIVAIHEKREVIVVNPKRDKFRGLPRRYFDLLQLLKECWEADKLNKSSSEGFRTREDLSDLLNFGNPETVTRYFAEIRRMLEEIGIDVEAEIYEKKCLENYFCGYRLRDKSVVIKSRLRRRVKA